MRGIELKIYEKEKNVEKSEFFKVDKVAKFYYLLQFLFYFIFFLIFFDNLEFFFIKKFFCQCFFIFYLNFFRFYFLKSENLF